MALKKHHKWMIGGFSTIVLIFMIITVILLNGIIVKQQINHNELSNRIVNLQADTQNKLNESPLIAPELRRYWAWRRMS